MSIQEYYQHKGSVQILKETLQQLASRSINNHIPFELWLKRYYPGEAFRHRIRQLLIRKRLFRYPDYCNDWMIQNGLAMNMTLEEPIEGYDGEYHCGTFAVVTELGQDFLTNFIQHHLYPNHGNSATNQA